MGGCGERYSGFLPQMIEPETMGLLHGAGNALLATGPQKKGQAPHVRMMCPSHCLMLFLPKV